MSVQSESGDVGRPLNSRDAASKTRRARLEDARGRISPDAVAAAGQTAFIIGQKAVSLRESIAIRGSKATICPRNGNRSPAVPGNEIRAGPRPSIPRGRIDLNVRRQGRGFLDPSGVPGAFPNLAKDYDSQPYISWRARADEIYRRGCTESC